MKLRFLVSPFFLNRYYLHREVKNIVSKYSFTGTIIDIGCGSKPYKPLFTRSQKYLGIDFENYSDNNVADLERPDYFFDDVYRQNSELPFNKHEFNHSFAFQVLEHHPNPEKLISEMYRITKKGGYLFLSVPFIGGIHEEPHDYQRYTKFGLINVFKKNNCKIVELRNYGYFCSTISMLINEGICNFANKSRTKHLMSILIYPPFLLLQYVTFILDLFFKSENIVRGYVILAKK